MGDDGQKRWLSAILAADVAGYTRLVEQDTDGTVAAWQAACADIIDPAIAEYSGRIVKHTGDGFLAEFPTVQQAVTCAISMQERLADSPLDFRMGVNLGDIIDDGEDIHGEGVNIAARIEALAKPGGISISGMVYESVRNRIDATFEDTGEHEIKHVSAPVRVYRVVDDGAMSPEDQAGPPAPATGDLALPDKPSIAVLPFDNMSGDAEQEYFADGITEDIITDLSKMSGLFVIARNSSFAYKGQSVNTTEVSNNLGVRYLLEGSVRKAGGRVRITAQLIDCTTGGHVWAERFDRDLEDIFAVQDEVTRQIVKALELKLSNDQWLIRGKGTDSVEAYDCCLRGRDLVLKFTELTNAAAQELFEKAIELDPEFPMPHAALALTLCNDHINQWGDDHGQALERACELAERALALDDKEPIAHFAIAVASTWTRDLDRALAAARRAIDLDPNYAAAHSILGNTLTYAGQPADAIEKLEMTRRLDPEYPDMVLHFLGHAQFMQGHYEEAAEHLQDRIARKPNTDISRVMLASAYGHLGRNDEARQQWEKALEVNPSYSLEQKREVLPYKRPEDFERLAEGLRKAGLPE